MRRDILPSAYLSVPDPGTHGAVDDGDDLFEGMTVRAQALLDAGWVLAYTDQCVTCRWRRPVDPAALDAGIDMDEVWRRHRPGAPAASRQENVASPRSADGFGRTAYAASVDRRRWEGARNMWALMMAFGALMGVSAGVQGGNGETTTAFQLVWAVGFLLFVLVVGLVWPRGFGALAVGVAFGSVVGAVIALVGGKPGYAAALMLTVVLAAVGAQVNQARRGRVGFDA